MDLSHTFGEDLRLSPTGGFATAAGTDLSIEKIVRRILTNLGDDPFASSYGGGFRSFIGSPGNADRVKAVVKSQMRLEVGVDQSQPISIDVYRDRQGASTFVSITFVSSETGQTVRLTPIGVN